MEHAGRLLGVVFGALVVVATGCEVIVGSDLPAFACTPGDPSACPVGQACSPAGVCVAACPDNPCEDGAVCNTDAHVCVPMGQGPDGGDDDAFIRDGQIVDRDSPSSGDVVEGGRTDGSLGDVGASCVTNANCGAGLLCADSSILTPPVVQTTGPVCTKTCCRSEDCPADFACYSPGTGGNYCVRAAQLPRGTANGSKAGGATCATGAECRSGVCMGPGTMRCADACCADGAACSGGGVCRQVNVEGHETWACGDPPAGTTGNNSFCSLPDDCKSNLCYPSSGGTCRPRCCGHDSCQAQTPKYGACVYDSFDGPVQEYFAFCLYPSTSPPGSKKIGEACAGASDCASYFCDPTALTCTDVCCTDSDCASYAAAGYSVCRPSINPRYLTCQKP